MLLAFLTARVHFRLVQPVAYQDSGSSFIKQLSSWLYPPCTGAWGYSSPATALAFPFVEFYEIPVEAPPNMNMIVLPVLFREHSQIQRYPIRGGLVPIQSNTTEQDQLKPTHFPANCNSSPVCWCWYFFPNRQCCSLGSHHTDTIGHILRLGPLPSQKEF